MGIYMQKILVKANVADFEFLVGTLDSYVNLSSDTKMREGLEELRDDASESMKMELSRLLEGEIRYAGSAELAYFCRWLFADEAGVSTDEIVGDVAGKLGVKLRMIGPTEAKIERLVKAVVEKQFLDLSPEQQREMLREQGIGKGVIDEILKRLKEHGKVAAIPILLQIIGREAVEKIVTTVVIRVIAGVMGRDAAKQLIMHLATKFPWWAEWIGPVAWGITAGWVALDVQGPAYRKTIPAMLYLGLVGLRDGPEDGDEFWTEN